MAFRYLAAVAILGLTSCDPESTLITPGQAIRGDIHSGEHLSFRIHIPPGAVARVSVTQEEIDLALDAGGVHVDSAEFGSERIYLHDVTSFTIAASAEGPARGRFRLTLDGFSSGDPLALEAQMIETAGNALFDRRTAETHVPAQQQLGEAAMRWLRAGDPLKEAQTLVNYGRSLERTASYNAADQAYERALDLLRGNREQAGELDARKTWANLGGYVGQERANVAALKNVLSGWRAVGDRRGMASIANSLARRLDEERSRAEAVRFERQAIEWRQQLGDERGVAECLLRLSGLLRQSSEAITRIQEAADIYRRRGDQRGELDVLQTLALHPSFDERHADAATLYGRRRLLHRQQGDWSGWMTATVSLAEIERRRGRSEAGWALLQELEARAIYQQSATTVPSSRFGRRTGYFDAGVAVKFITDPASANFVERAFLFIDRGRADFVPAAPRSNLAAIQAALTPQDMLLEFIDDPHQSTLVWAVTQQRVGSHRIPRPPFAKEILQALTQPGQSTLAQRQRLAQGLLGSFRGQLTGKRLLIVPEETLSGIPFAALPDPDHDDGSLLGDHHEIVYLPSVQAILTLREQARPASDDTFAVVADPVLNRYDTRLRAGSEAVPESAEWVATARSAGVYDEGQGLPRLASAAGEMRALARLGGGHRVRAATGFDVTRESTARLATHAQFVHFATHAFVDYERPDRSGLALSLWSPGGKAVDGYWRFDEIATSHMAADLVTLGACETGIGRHIGHQGVPSLSNAFLRAGARRVVSSLWKVDDAATSALMIEFYRQLFSPSKPTPAHALHLAQKHVAAQAKWQDPYYWAGFVLYGDWRPL